MQPESDAVGWLAELGTRETLLVAAFRNAAVALGQDRDDYWAHVENNLGGLTAMDRAVAAVVPFRNLMYTIGLYARGEVRFHTPDCPCLGRDEANFVRICRLAGSGMHKAAEREATALVDRAVSATLVAQVVEFDMVLSGTQLQHATGSPTACYLAADARIH